MKQFIPIFLFLSCLFELIYCQTNNLNQYNVIWSTQSKNSSESMPVGGGDIGCNVWVENGELLFYMQRSGCFNEIGEYVKLGRIRVKLSPNPFENSRNFKQKLILKDGYCEIKAKRNSKADFDVKLKFHVDVFQPVIHLDIESEKPLTARIAYENWRISDRELKDGYYGERFGTFTLEGYPGKVIKLKDDIEPDKNGVLFYHKNPAKAALPGILIEQQGMQKHKNEIYDNISNRTFGGYMGGKDWLADGVSESKYLSTPYRAWWIKSSHPAKKLSLTISTKIEQTSNTTEWKKGLLRLHAVAEKVQKKEFAKSIKWWNNFQFANSGNILSKFDFGLGVEAQSKTKQVGILWDDQAQEMRNYNSNSGFYAVYSARIGYAINKNWNVALLANNIFDKTYYSTVGNAYGNYWYGDPRNYLLTLSGTFE